MKHQALVLAWLSSWGRPGPSGDRSQSPRTPSLSRLQCVLWAPHRLHMKNTSITSSYGGISYTRIVSEILHPSPLDITTIRHDPGCPWRTEGRWTITLNPVLLIGSVPHKRCPQNTVGGQTKRALFWYGLSPTARSPNNAVASNILSNSPI